MRIRNDIDLTYGALNSFYLNTDAMRVNTDYLNEAIITWLANTEKFVNELKNKRRKTHSIVWAAFEDLTNAHIREIYYPRNQDVRCTSYQLKKWLSEYGCGFAELAEANEYFDAWRKEHGYL